MNSTQKAKETRQKNKVKKAQKAQTEKRIREAIISSCLSVLEAESSSVDQRLEASKILFSIRKGLK